MSSKHVFPLILDGAVQAIATASSSKAWNGLTSYVTVAAAGGNFEMSLGSAEHAGTVVTVIKIDGSNTVTVNPTADFDSSAATVELNLDKESVSFMWDGSAWRLFQQDQSNSTAFTGGSVANATTFASALTIANAVKLDIASAGAVAEATNRATGVTLNQVAGVVSTNAASLTDDTAATLTVTNSVCTANSVVIVVPGTNFNDLGGSSIEVTPGAGSFTIEYKNVSGGAVATAQTFRFVVLNLV